MLLQALQRVADAGAGTLTPTQIEQLQQLAAGLNPVQAAWISGYLAALAQQEPVAQVAPQANASLTILYGSQTGNARGLAEGLAEHARSQGHSPKLVSMADYNPRQLKQEQQLILLVSTHGEGDPPDDALGLHKFLHSARAPKLDSLKFSVLALGDSSYDHFCQTGIDFDLRLEALGATRLVARQDCDVDFEAPAGDWQGKVLESLEAPGAAAQVVPIGVASSQAVNKYDRANPFTATLLASQKITGRDSIKDVRHVELDLADSGLMYQPGDALGVWMDNDPALVAAILAATGLDGNQAFGDDTLVEALTKTFELTLLHPALVKGWAELTSSDELTALADDKAALKAFIKQHQLLDLAQAYPASPSAEQLTGLLRKLTPRLYSIASSQAEVEDEVHLTVALVNHGEGEDERLGTVSGALTRRLEEGDEVRVYVEPNERFRLPGDDSTPIIMIGPGTGVAPYRAFLQERAARGVSGNSWLFFGNPHFTQDFLYQLEWQGYVKDGSLAKITLAFSRDQEHKIYVQDRIREHGAELWQWLERGAHLYLCGDAEHMAPAVEAELLAMARDQGGLDDSAAKEWLDDLKQARRYQKDVY